MIQAKPKAERTTRQGRPKLQAERADLIVKLYNDNYKIRDIAASCKVSTSTIYRVLRERRVKQ